MKKQIFLPYICEGGGLARPPLLGWGLNAKFNNCKEFIAALEEYSKATYQTFVKDDSKMVESVKKHQNVIFQPTWSMRLPGYRASATARNANKRERCSLARGQFRGKSDDSHCRFVVVGLMTTSKSYSDSCFFLLLAWMRRVSLCVEYSAKCQLLTAVIWLYLSQLLTVM